MISFRDLGALMILAAVRPPTIRSLSMHAVAGNRAGLELRQDSRESSVQLIGIYEHAI